MAKRRFRLPRDLHMCRVTGCATVIEHWKVLCDGHFRLLPSATKAEIRDARASKLPGAADLLMIKAAATLPAIERDRSVAVARRTAEMMGERDV